GKIFQSSPYMSAQAIIFPSLSKAIPLDRPVPSKNNEMLLLSASHLKILSFGWSVKNTFPHVSTAGPSTKLKPVLIISKLPLGIGIVGVSTLSSPESEHE